MQILGSYLTGVDIDDGHECDPGVGHPYKKGNGANEDRDSNQGMPRLL
jgi:hypothetical protein